MLRRSAPALLGLLVCLFAAHLASASGALGFDESKIKVSLDERQTRVRLEVGNGTGRDFAARLRVEMLDPKDAVRASAETGVRVRRGTNSFEVPLGLRHSELPESDRSQFPWFRLRYHLTPDGGEGAAAEGVVSISEVTPDLFELSVVSPRKARAGSTFTARVRAANPLTQRPAKGVAVEATLTFDTDEGDESAKASGMTDGEGLASLDFALPRGSDADDDARLRVTARRGSFAQQAGADVEIGQEPRVLLTTDKPLYQPGQTAHMRALVFDPTEHVLAGEEVTFRVEDEEGQTSFSETLKTSRFGVASVDWRVPEGSRLGTYTLKLEMEDDRFDIDYGARTEFKVSRYDLPNFAVTAKPDRPFYLAGESPSIEVRADYLFGQPVKRGRVRVVRQTERRWNYKEQKYETEEHPAVEGLADAEGRFDARLDVSGEHKELDGAGYQRYRDITFAAYVTDPTTNRTEQRRFSLRLTKDPIHVYVSEGRFRQAKGLPLAFYLSTFYADGTPAECEVVASGEDTIKAVFSPDGRRHDIREPGHTLFKVRTNRYGVAKVSATAVSRDEERNNIPLRFLARDRQGREGRHGEDLWLSSYRSDVPEIRVETNKTVYREGEPVSVELTSDARSMSVVVDAVSQGRVLFSKSVRLSGGRASLVIPPGADFAGPITVAANSSAPTDEDDEDYSSGARTVVFPRDRELKLDVKLSQKSFRPGEEAGAQFALRTADGRRAAGALGVVVFDKAVEERARTDDEFSRGFGFAGSFHGLWYGQGDIAGVTYRDVERLDTSRAMPDGFETVAEMLYNGDRHDGDRHAATGTEFTHDLPGLFSDLINGRLDRLKAIVGAQYKLTAVYPADEAALSRMLAEGGLDFASLRDPWGQPYSPRFSFERELQKLDLYSTGADERPETDDDFTVARFSWPYFRKTGEVIDRATADYLRRTGVFIRDRDALGGELRRAGLDLDALRDRWGRPYRFDFGVSGTNYVVNVLSAGADGVFDTRAGSYASDDFVVWVSNVDYFETTRKVIEAALAAHLREANSFPETREALAAALSKASIRLDDLRDGWGTPLRAVFSSHEQLIGGTWGEDRRRYDAAGGAHHTAKSFKTTIHEVTLRSAGPDSRAGTPDDFTLAFYTDGAAARPAAPDASPTPFADAAPTPFAQPVSFSGGTGAIKGSVTDVQGAAVAGVTVTARHNYASLEFKTVTNEEGIYILSNLPSGVYTLSIEAQGFRRAVIDQVRVQSSNLTKLDVALEVASVSETVEVTGSSLTIETSTSSMVSSSVRERQAGVRAPISTPRLREFFPETLVWSPELETAPDGTASLKFKLADNITTWKMSVIASTEDGRLGTIEREFLAFQPFFVEHDPPRVLTEGDEISLPVVLRNYLARAQGVDVEMKPESWFTLGGPARLHEEVPAGEAARPAFDFRVVASVRDGRQRVTAVGADASDAIEKPVTVHPDGEERSLTEGTVFTDAGALGVRVPADVIRGSLRGELKLYPNLSAHLLEGVEAIMERPHGCGEQTISSTYPSVLVLGLYDEGAAGREDLPPVVKRARSYAQLGYERLLGYRAAGGGFTYWGGGEPDLALTAYALRFLKDAGRVIEVDGDVVSETRAWLLRQQQEDGSWPAPRRYNDALHKRQTALTTAFIARVLAATQKAEGASATPTPSPLQTTTQTPGASAAPSQAAPLQRALSYLAARAEEADEPYLIASFMLAAADAGEPEAVARGAARLRALAREEGAGTFWETKDDTPFHGWGLAGRIETTALAVQALNRFCGLPNAACDAKKDEGAVEAVQPSTRAGAGARRLLDRGLFYLLRNKDRYGVWHSTQATINVFDALLSTGVSGGAPDARRGAAAAADTAEVFVNGRRAGQLALPPSDRVAAPLTLDLSPFLDAGDNRVEIRRAGSTRQAQAQLVSTFYVPWPAPKAAADAGATNALRLAVGYERTSVGVNEEVTCSVEAQRTGGRGSGMLLAEVGLPPGADVDRASLDRAVEESGWTFSRYDVMPDRLVVYLWPQGDAARFRFKFRPRYGLNALTAPSQLYDYYNPEARTVVAPTRFVVR